MQTLVSRPPLSVSGFLGAAFSAPGLAVFICGVGALVTTLASDGFPKELGSGLFGLLFLFIIATVWGAVPSLVFGGLVLALIQRVSWRRQPSAAVFTAGGAAAASLYVLTALGVAALSPGAAMFFAPWATPHLLGPTAGDLWWVIASLLLAGAVAGRFYALCVKRG